ncbi:MAG: HEPN domain-containing protein [Phycisphaerae bacterium]
MPEQRRFPPDDPREWVKRARSDLALARRAIKGVYLEDLCFHAQQAAEKAIKAVLISQEVEFPYVHDLRRLLELVEKAGVLIPDDVQKAESLTRFAVVTRYPGVGRAPSVRDHKTALRLAQTVVRWAEQILSGWRKS